jgi:hypothetical protein
LELLGQLLERVEGGEDPLALMIAQSLEGQVQGVGALAANALG